MTMPPSNDSSTTARCLGTVHDHALFLLALVPSIVF